jgi:hypothetical protein
MGERWLVCEILKGVFSDEVAVRYVVRDREGVSFFVPRDKVRIRDKNRGEVIDRVVVRGGAPYAVVPTEDQAMIPVREEDLVAP